MHRPADNTGTVNNYGNKELSELNSQELSHLYQKSKSTANAGLIMTIAGSAAAVGGVYFGFFRMMNDIVDWEYSGDAVYDLTLLAVIGGTMMVAVGVPTLVIGLQRKGTIQNVIDSQETSTMLQIIPSFQYDHSLRGYASGLKLCIIF